LTDKATRTANPLPTRSVATRVIGSTGTEAANMADSITIIALQPLQTLTPSGVIQWVRGAATLGTQTTWARPSIQNPPKGAEAPSLPDLFIVRVSDLGGSYCPRYDFSHFNRPWTRIFQGAPAIVILLPIAKITSQVGKSRSARTATDTAPSI
jgi:hypothetical protein